MAAYAALVTLINLMEDMQNHPRISTSLDKKQIESLGEKVHFLLNFIESYKSHGGSNEAEDLESQIASAAQEAEDVIELHIVDRILAGSAGDEEISSSFLPSLQNKIRNMKNKIQERIRSKDEKSRLQKVMKNMDSIKKKIVKIEKKAGFRDDSVLATSSRQTRPSFTTQKTTMVGFDDELIQLLDVLTGQQSTRQVISIVGMGGIGKTTLTRNAFENSLIVEHFDIRSWTTVSQEYSAREILLELSYEGKSTSKSDSELGEQLYKNLLGKRYLIVLDDMWSIDAWDDIRLFLPDNGHRSRIVVTTRLSNLASHVSSSSFVMNFLDKEKSWKLFCEKAFGEDDCPPELVEIGKEIVEQCQGLPLSIVVIGGYLSKSSWAKEHWECIANDINTVLSSGEDDQCLKILSLSYSHLPVYLKPCFLYMGTFLEDEQFSVPWLIRLWVAEGFLKLNKDQSLEEIAESYFNDLVDRNLILVHRYGDNGKIVTCKIHDLLRVLCLKVAEKEKFLCVLKLIDTPRPINRERRVVIHGSTLEEYCDIGLYCALNTAPLVRSLICEVGEYKLPNNFKLLKILTAASEFEDVFDTGKFHQQVNLRYLECNLYFDEDTPYYHLPSSISLLWNLQTLYLEANSVVIVAPSEIWEMPQLRHLVCSSIHLPDPPLSNQKHGFVLRNLQTLSEVWDFRLSEEVCKRIPNIKDLSIRYGVPGINCLENLGCFRKLESLACYFEEEGISRNFALSLTFPSSLQELSLNRCLLLWEDLTMVGSLPHLVVLKLGLSVKGKEWSPIEGEFCRLKYLEIWGCDDLVNWNAESSHFPVLESLILRCISKLAEIPSGIGEIPTLRRIQLECGVPAAVSAMRILVEQESLGNEDLQLEVRLWYQEEHQSFREMVQEEDLNSNNLRLSNPYMYGSNVRHGEKKLKKKTEDAKDKPKTPPTAFFVFMDDFEKQYKEKNPNNRSIAAICKAGGDKWRSMSEEEKTPFVAEAEKWNEVYERNVEAYNCKLAEGCDDDPDNSMSEVDDEDEEEGSGEGSELFI